jgi:hypothetical protein
LAALVTVSQAAPLDTAQVQPVCALTLTLPEVLAAVYDALPGVIETVHGTPACVTLKVWLSMAIVPVREVIDVFAATV